MAYRYFFLQTHYRQQQNFNDEAIGGAAVGYRRLLIAAIEVRGESASGSDNQQRPYRERFRAAMFDDLNAPKAMAVVWEVARSSELAAADRRDLLLEFDEILGLDLAAAELTVEASESDPRIDALVKRRTEARSNKDWAEADRIRDELAAEGIVVTDTPDGATWRRE
jgi:cysteinyl-tRNA synthetase